MEAEEHLAKEVEEEEEEMELWPEQVTEISAGAPGQASLASGPS